jgi:hypothetical protein
MLGRHKEQQKGAWPEQGQPAPARAPQLFRNEDEAPLPDDPAENPLGLVRDLALGRAGPLRQRDIRFSTGFVLGGLTVALAGAACIMLAQTHNDASTWALRRLGGVLGGAGLLTLLFGILAGLPANRWLRGLGVLGVLLGSGALALFAWAYPDQWSKVDAPDWSVPVIALYTLGAAMLVGAAFAALVADFVLRWQTRARLQQELGREPTDEEIRRDIEEAWRRHKVSWGGVAMVEGKGLTVKVEPLPAEYLVGRGKVGKQLEVSGDRAAAVDSAVGQLSQFRGGRMRTGELPEGGMQDAALALRSLRQERAAAPKPGLWARLLMWLGLRPRTWQPPSKAR